MTPVPFIPTSSIPGGSAAPMENSQPGIQTMPSGALTGGGDLFSTVGPKPGGSEAAALQLRTESRRVHREPPAVLATSNPIQTRAEANLRFAEGAFPFER